MNVILTLWRGQLWVPMARTSDDRLAAKWARQVAETRGEKVRVVGLAEWQKILAARKIESYLERKKKRLEMMAAAA